MTLIFMQVAKQPMRLKWK